MTAEKRKTKGTPNPVDMHVGQRLKIRRSLLGMSQEKLGKSIDLTFQQIQKYEQGTNRISAGKLYQISNILKVPVSYFFDNIISQDVAAGLSDNKQEDLVEDYIISNKETLELVRLFTSIKDDSVRKNTLKLLRSIAEQKNN